MRRCCVAGSTVTTAWLRQPSIYPTERRLRGQRVFEIARPRNLRVTSSSSIASAVAKAFSHRKFCSAPSANVFCTKERLPGLFRVRPARNAEFRASLKDSPRCFMADRISASTSGSRVTVVRIPAS